MAQWVKDLALSLQWLRSLLGCGFDPWSRNFHRTGAAVGVRALGGGGFGPRAQELPRAGGGGGDWGKKKKKKLR